MNSHSSGEEKSPARFPITSWTLIRTVQQGTEADAAAAMEEVCRQYWYPVYAFTRHHGFSASDAEDLTQDFFRALIARKTIQAAREEKGRLRSFILHMLRDLIRNHRRDRMAAKRGSGAKIVSLSDRNAEERYAREPAEIRNPIELFDRAWAERVLRAATRKLRDEFAEADNLDDFELLQQYLPQGDNATSYPEAAEKLGVTEATLRLQIHRMRKRYGKLIEAEIAQTVSSPEDARDELDYLMSVIGAT